MTSKLLLDRKQLNTRLERSEHYLELIEQLSDVVYELDPHGRFLHVSPAVTPLLGYSPADLVGQPYTFLLTGDERTRAEGRFNERRTGERATRHLELRILGKRRDAATPAMVGVELSATGLYGPQQEFLGTVGLLKDTGRLLLERDRARSLELQLSEAAQDRQADIALRQTAEQLRSSLSGMSAETQDLLKAMQDMRLEARLQQLRDDSARVLQERVPTPSTRSAVTETPAVSPADTAAQPPTAPPAMASPLPSAPPPPSTPVSSDRRRAERIACELLTRLHLDAQTWDGTTRNLGLGGLFLTVTEPVPVMEKQQVQIGLQSEVGIFELHGVVRGMREWGDPLTGSAKLPITGLAIEFGPFGPYEEQILASMIHGLTEQSVQLQVTVTVLPSGPEMVSRPSGSLYGDLKPEQEEPSRWGDLAQSLTPERRGHERGNVVMSVRLELCGPAPTLKESAGRTTNLSVTGCCLSLPPAAPVGARGYVTFSPPIQGSTRSGKGARQTVTVLAEVVWSAPDLKLPTELRQESPPHHRVGLRFLHGDPDSDQRMRDFVARLLPIGEGEVVTVAAECTNEVGQHIAISHDHPRKPLPPGSPTVIISPGFGETKRDYVALAYWLCLNGFHVLRYDHTCHVGDSDGPMERTTLSGMQQDLRAVVDLAERLLPASPLAVIAHNLSGRIALKAAASEPRIKLLVLLAGVVEVQATLQGVHHEDLVAGYLAGTRLGHTNLLGFTVDADRWLGDAISHGLEGFHETIKDAELIQAPVIFLAAERDPWVQLKQLKEVQGALRSNLRHLLLLVDTPNRLRDNPRTARVLLRQIVSCCVERFYPLAPKGKVTTADPGLAVRQGEIERLRSRQRHSLSKPVLVDFWQTYLDHFHTAARSSEFWRLYDHIYRLLGATDKGGTILDAGCGHGDFGVLLSLNHAYRHRTSTGGTPWSTTYVGLDVVPDATQQARRQLALVADEIRIKFPTTQYPHVLVRSSLMVGDLDQPLPYRDGQFDRIVCNLTLSFLRDPMGTLREFMRVLAPSGRLVVTVLAKHADLSPIFLSVLQRATRPEEIEEARWLWTQWGLIRETEANGVFRFFDRQELLHLFKACGAPHPRLYPALAEQALVVVAEKSVR
jgi:PAS domain S-box-containing protein